MKDIEGTKSVDAIVRGSNDKVKEKHNIVMMGVGSVLISITQQQNNIVEK